MRAASSAARPDWQHAGPRIVACCFVLHACAGQPAATTADSGIAAASTDALAPDALACGTWTCDLGQNKCVEVKGSDPTCCDKAEQCATRPGGDPCSAYTCVANRCVQGAKKPGCCASDADCPPPPASDCSQAVNKCTPAGSCFVQLPDTRKCATDADCKDNKCGRIGWCDDTDDFGPRVCVYALATEKCEVDADCVDGNPCTADSCGPPTADCAGVATCVHKAKVGCP